MPTTLDLSNVKLPSLPSAAVKIIELVQDPDVDVPLLGKTIEMDPALAARVVRLANSSMFGLTREIASVRQALVILGLRTVKLAALNFTLLDALGPESRARALAHCWKQILTNAMGCRLMAPLFTVDPEEGFLCGLMQDIGILVNALMLGDDYLDLLEGQTDVESPPLEQLEREKFGFTHSEVAVQLIEQWRLPSKLTHAIREHTQIELPLAFKEQRRDLAVLLKTTEVITGFLTKPSMENLETFTLVADEFGESSSEIDKFVQRIEMQVQEMADLLDLKLPQGKTYSQILVQARELTKDLRLESREQLPLRVRQELARAKREKTCLSLLLLRVTTISQLSKSGQNELADQLQTLVARQLQETTRESDSLYRLNISTLCVVACNTPTDGVERLIQRLVPKLNAISLANGSEQIQPRFAFGVVTLTQDSRSDVNVETFLLKANDNLSDAVQSGEVVCSTVY